MADIAISPTSVNVGVSADEAAMPSHQKAEYSTKNTNNNDIRFAGRGKSVLTLSIDNAPNKLISCTLYGMHESDGEVGDAGVFPLDDTWTVLAASKEVNSYIGFACPWYLLRLTHSESPTDSPAKAVSVWIDLAGV